MQPTPNALLNRWYALVREKRATRQEFLRAVLKVFEIKDVNATWLGRIVQRSAAPKTNITVTAFRGWRAFSTRPMQDESGRTPSRATAKMSREAATIATLVL